MISIITGDIINSRKVVNQDNWIKPLKTVLSKYGRAPKNWEIFRGDSFQLEISKPEESFWVATYIKAHIRSTKDLDVRMAIGIGRKTFTAPKITESNGPAFINSGEQFELLKKIRKNLAIKSPWPNLDSELNLMINLASIAMDKWSPSSAELVVLSMGNDNLSQKELGEKIGRRQSSISERQSRAHYGEIAELEIFFRKKILHQLEIQ